MARESLSPSEARRGVLAAQGLAGEPAAGPVGARQVLGTVRRLALLQVDSVNVVSRAHYLPVYSRLGHYARETLDRAGSRAPRRLFEYWGHEASLLPVETQPDLRWRMDQDHAWSGVAAAAADNPAHVAEVLAAVRELGPVTVRDLEKALSARPHPKTSWGWNWSTTKRVVAQLFWSGEVTSAGRDPAFARRYDLTERVLPAAVLNAPTPSRADAIRHLVERAARALGVATAGDLQDYFRLQGGECRTAIGELVDAGILQPVSVTGWPPAWRYRSLRIPRPVDRSTLLVPFDPLIWDRRRVHRLFAMHYRIEIYVPAAKRQFGYYVLPFLMGDGLVARVDLKADRAAAVLLVRGAFAEPQHVSGAVAPALAGALVDLATWLGLSSVHVGDAGDLAPSLRGLIL